MHHHVESTKAVLCCNTTLNLVYVYKLSVKTVSYIYNLI